VHDTALYDAFTAKLVNAIEGAGFTRRAAIQSFDWRTIVLAHRLDPPIASRGWGRRCRPGARPSRREADDLDLPLDSQRLPGGEQRVERRFVRRPPPVLWSVH
jgi:hypothetical protein